VNERLHDLFIFEMANNHQGSVEHGTAIIDSMGRVARKRDINAAVKFQFRNLDTFIHPGAAKDPDAPHVGRFQDTRLSENDFVTMIEAVRGEGMIPIATPFDEDSVGTCLDLGIEIIKVASCSATDWPLLEVVADAQRPMIVSTGGATLDDIDNVVSFLTHREVEFALLHCVAVYPAPRSALQLDFISRMARRYPYIPIGYSGHEAPSDVDAVKVAVSKGATILERHVGVATDDITLNAYSLDPDQVDAWVTSALDARELGGSGHEKRVLQEEIDSIRALARGVYAVRDLKEGEALARDDVYYAMPCEPGQLTSGEFGRYRTSWTASRDYGRDQAVVELPQPDPLARVRSVLHDARGMLYEAQIALGDRFEIEVSHHFGMEKIRQFGAIIVNVLNREYCKKLIIVLPGQRHPNHHHKVKEETFHLLWGDLAVRLDGVDHSMVPGDTLLIERGAQHAFTSRMGAIVEEISTTHKRGDSYYDDPVIARLDPVERKTVIDTW
jgi:sialic acid synthase SpsE/mannose-6-phosphate isomerase-like protein (cupin superfamily)